MNDIEEGCLKTLLENFPARMANGMRDTFDEEQLLDGDRDQLTAISQAWVEGYVAAQLSVIRGVTTGKPNLSGKDIEAIESLILQHEDEIVAQLYA